VRKSRARHLLYDLVFSNGMLHQSRPLDVQQRAGKNSSFRPGLRLPPQEPLPSSMASGVGESTPAASDRKKRALEALERRFAAEAERLQEHHHQEDQKAKRARIPVGDGESEQPKKFHSLERRSAAEAGRLQDPHRQDSRKSKRAPNSAGDSESEKQKEGHPTTTAATASSKKDEVHPVYLEISGIVHENLLQAGDLKVLALSFPQS
ncbi:hypothetical protein B296_00028945, partial [Ensete ventricosum]